MDTSVKAANKVVSVGADIDFESDPNFFACSVRLESSSVASARPTADHVYPLDCRHDGGYYAVMDCGSIGDLTPLCDCNSYVCFFFSSRRRHTRSLCDWSSDVCSSD